MGGSDCGKIEQLEPDCDKPVKKCNDNYSGGYGYAWIGCFILFIILVFIVWAVIYYCNPSWCLQCNETGACGDKVDSGRAFIAAVFIAFIILVFIGLIWLFVSAWSWGKC